MTTATHGVAPNESTQASRRYSRPNRDPRAHRPQATHAGPTLCGRTAIGQAA